MLKRPTPYEDEEEILRQQEEFFKQKEDNKIKSAAFFSKTEKKETHEENDSAQTETAETNVQDQIANTFEAIPMDIQLNNILENSNPSNSVQPKMRFTSHGFPKPARRDLDLKPKNGSIFSQQIKRMKQAGTFAVLDSVHSMEIDDADLDIKRKKPIDAGSSTQISQVFKNADKQAIHEENLQKLNSMTSEEILSEREKLISSMDPVLVQFIRSRKLKKIEECENRNPTIKEQNTSLPITLDELEAPKEVLSQPEASDWVNFNRFEASKLAWMKDISMTDLRKTTGFEARFDFEGYLLPYNLKQVDESNRHLYHHGDEPQRPGYSLKELLLLSRSSVIQQKVVALNTLSNVLALDQTGIYDKIIDIPLEQIFFVIRVCLDDNTPSVLNAGIKALRNLIYFQIDETCLDNTLHFGMGIIQPILALDHAMEDDNTVNDQQLAETNLIRCLNRTDILVRIRYIINTVKPPIETIIYCVEILIRMARDSDFIVNRLWQCEGLFQSLLKYFLPPANLVGTDKDNSDYYTPLPQVIKLLRVLASRNRTKAERLLNKYNTLDTIISYLKEEYFSQNATGLRLQIESMHYWIILLHYGLGCELIKYNENLLKRFLDYHFKNTNISLSTTFVRQSHLSALLLLIAQAVKKELWSFPPNMSECFTKWMIQFQRLKSFKCGHSQIPSSLFHCAIVSNMSNDSLYNSSFLGCFIKSQIFDLATQNMTNCSLLLNNYDTHKTTANLNSLQAAAWYTMDHIVPVLQTNSCIPFLFTMTNCVLNNNSNKVKIKFLMHPNILAYTHKLNTATSYYNIANWFTRCESFLIMNILKIAERVRDDIDANLYYNVAVKCLSVFRAEQKQDMQQLLETIIFCPRFYPVEIALENTSITKRTSELNEAWDHLNDAKEVYKNVLGLNKNVLTFDTTLSLDTSIGNVIPMDWIYTPLVVLYSNQQKRTKNEKVDEDADFYVVLNCLRWILIYETYFESLAECINPTEKYVRLSCLFLGSDSLFLHEDIQKYLVQIYDLLKKRESELNFEQEISGLTNFKDFFIQLLEQYQGVSYGNKVFGNILLFPLAKRHNITYRKTLWSEYMGVVETFTVRKDEVWMDYKDLIYPEDTDQSLGVCYLKALRSGSVRKGTIFYDVAEINVKHFKKISGTGSNKSENVCSDNNKMKT